MLRRTLLALFLVASAALAIAGNTPEAPPVPPALAAKDDEVRRLTESLEKAQTEKNDELLGRSLREMESLRHDSFVPYIRNAMKSVDTTVLAAAIRAAAAHELKDYEKDVRKLLHAKPPKTEPTGVAGEVGSAAIDYLTRLSFGGEEETVLVAYLRPLMTVNSEGAKKIEASWGPDLLRASVHYLGKFKARHAVPDLIELVGAPEKKPMVSNRDGGKFDPNPPEEYWRIRDKLWHDSEGWVRWALKEITGQDFRSVREWDAWYKLNRKDFR